MCGNDMSCMTELEVFWKAWEGSEGGVLHRSLLCLDSNIQHCAVEFRNVSRAHGDIDM